MNESQKASYEDLFEAYKKTQLVAYGSADQYQFHRNELCIKLAEFILLPYFEQIQNENEEEYKIEY